MPSISVLIAETSLADGQGLAVDDEASHLAADDGEETDEIFGKAVHVSLDIRCGRFRSPMRS